MSPSPVPSQSPNLHDEEWKDLKLSLERPYKDDAGEKLPTLLDIEADGKFIYESKETLDDRLKNHLHRIFQERGVDFFDNPDKRFIHKIDAQKDEQAEDEDEDASKEEVEAPTKHMTFEELNAMRAELMPQLYVALGEVTQAQDILNSLLSTVQTSNPNTVQSLLSGGQQALAPSPPQRAPGDPALTATVVTKPPPITSLQAFNAQLVIGSKDEALRKAANLFDTVATRLEKSQKRGEQYWVNALKVRRSNWRLIPSPLPPGSIVGKGADRTSKDFLVSYGLEESSPDIRQAALASLTDAGAEHEIIFAHRQGTRMQISLRVSSENGAATVSRNTMEPEPEKIPVDAVLKRAQCEIINQEMFKHLVQEATIMPTILARVSERTISIDVAEGMELRMDMVKDRDIQPVPVSPLCDIIYHGLHVLLLRKHGYHKGERLSSTTISNPTNNFGGPPILQPIIDFLQYNLFCKRLESELTKASRGLTAAGIHTTVSFNGVGETGEELVQIFTEFKAPPISGEAVLTIAERHSIRFTFVAPSNLTAHLSQAKIHVYSMVQLSQLLQNEIERFLLQRICQIGQKLKGGTWLVDLDQLVARWEGCVLTFQLAFEKDLGINFSAFRLDSQTGRRGHLYQYSRLNATNSTLLTWVEDVISKVP
ncbi:hypothetical protein D9611_002473 [Ephemerocybe angulata]|uniref:Mediator of RNA polymerase II transcription subunit 17 n=1 Tax=Ephemerocybe angulata TaxID=980116 RepID=A0A8H5FDU3_9AGAR|nr:hypothetical protein D9611_002473 [Tulosesus angulatus]